MEEKRTDMTDKKDGMVEIEGNTEHVHATEVVPPEDSLRQVIRLAKPQRIVRSGTTAKTEEEDDGMNALDRKLAKEEAAAKAANVIAAKDPVLHGRTRFQARASEIAMALTAALIGSFATVAIMLPNGLTFGGITGIARIIQASTGWNYSIIYYALAMTVAAFVWIGLGFKELRKIILMSISYPTIMLLLQMSGVEFIIEDKFLAAVFCGVILGVSNGLTFKAGFSSGGTDSIAKVIKYKSMPHLGINDITFAINTLIVVFSAAILGLNIALYAVITIYVSMRIGEAVMFGLSTKIVELEIIPGDPDALTEYIMKELGRGVSSVEITGEYTGDKRKQLKILCSPRESFLIKRHLAKNDPKSFVAVYGVNSVWGVGRGFSDIRSME
ncbi:MAG: YitT family protein [Mogibacterium sp.]|nr:YitT family protein [Mogibacterium sp.]